MRRSRAGKAFFYTPFLSLTLSFLSFSHLIPHSYPSIATPRYFNRLTLKALKNSVW